MHGELAKTWSANGLQAIMNLTVVPFGNAKIDPASGNTTCQHGAEECLGNSYEQCAIAHNPDPKDHVPFYLCLEATGGKPDFDSAAAKCAASSNIDINALTTCVRGAEAAALQQRFHDLTPADHKYTPWVTLNGVQMVTNKVPTLSHHICSLWKAAGGKKPAGCPLI